MSKSILLPFACLSIILFILSACAPPVQPPAATELPIESPAKNGDSCQAITPDGPLPGMLKTSELDADSDQPAGIAVGSNGMVFVTINNSHRIVGYDANGQQAADGKQTTSRAHWQPALKGKSMSPSTIVTVS